MAVISLVAGADATEQPACLPAPIRSLLDAHYTGWRIPVMNEETADAWRQAFGDAPANVLQADYDRDGQIDYAVLVEYRAPTDDGRLVPHRRALAFLRRRQGYRLFTLSRPVEVRPLEGLHVWPAPSGAELYDLDADTEVTLERDGVAVRLEGRGPCFTFVFRGDTFASLWTCD